MQETISKLIEASFPDEHHRGGPPNDVVDDYPSSRKITNDVGDGYYLADIGDIESDIAMYDANLKQEMSIDYLAQRDLRHRILNRVKNTAQHYLMEIESSAGSSTPDEAEE